VIQSFDRVVRKQYDRWSLKSVQNALKESASYDQVVSLAKTGKGKDKDGYRKEFIELVKKSKEVGREDYQHTIAEEEQGVLVTIVR